MGEFDRIARQIDQYLLQPHAITKQMTRHIRPDANQEVEILFRGIDGHDARQTIENVIQIELGRRYLHASGFNFREVQNVVEYHQQRTASTADHLDVLILRWVQRRVFQ